VDVAIDEFQILGHLSVEARDVWETTISRTHDSHLHKAFGCATHQWAAIVPLWRHKQQSLRCCHCVCLSSALFNHCFNWLSYHTSEKYGHFRNILSVSSWDIRRCEKPPKK